MLEALVTAAAVAALAAPAQTTLTADVRAMPTKAGTAKRPAGVKLDGKLQLTTPDGAAWPVVTAFEIWFGPGITFKGDAAPACRVSALSNGGPSACPAKSIMGAGSLGRRDPNADFGQGNNITFVNAPGGSLTAWVVLQDPARVQAAAIGTVVDGRPGPWPHRQTWTIPRSLQLVAGIPITLNSLSFAIGGKSWAKTYVATTRCPAGGWAWRVRVHTMKATGAAAVLDTRGRTPCHR
jgi:hypothetical protein